MSPALLVVDDDPPMRHLLDQALTEAGYRVAAVNDGSAAIAMLERRSFRPDGLIIDLQLGEGPDGYQVARRARELSPSMAVVYITGGRQNEWRPDWAPDGVVLLKPFSLEQMLTVTAEVVQG